LPRGCAAVADAVDEAVSAGIDIVVHVRRWFLRALRVVFAVLDDREWQWALEP